ncbi:glucokinase [Sphingomonas sp. CJ99]
MNDPGDPPRLAVSVGETQIRLAWVNPAGRPVGEHSWPMASFPTLTDALMRFERETGQPLTGADAAIAIIGATHGDTISIARGRWMITRSGLHSIFRREPQIINDVAVHAWAAVGGHGVRFDAMSRAAPPPDLGRQGRWLIAHLDFGVGLASIDVDGRGGLRVLEAEMGHCGFPPETDQEWALVQAMRTRLRGSVSWEAVLTLALDDPIWNAPALPNSRADRLAMLARLIGRFAGDAVLAHGAWSGAFLMGRRISELTGSALTDQFNKGFEAKPKFARLVGMTPRWRLSGHDLTMEGLAYALTHRTERTDPPAALSPAIPRAAVPEGSSSGWPSLFPPAASPGPTPRSDYMPVR